TMQAVAPPLGVEVIPINMRNAAEIEQSVGTFARSPNGGLIPVSSAAALRHRELILTLAAKHKLPAVYWDRFFVTAGGLMSFWAGSHRSVPPSSRLRRPDPQGREAKRPAGAGADQVRAGDQPQDRQDTWSRSAAQHARPRRGGDRIRYSFIAAHLSAYGTKRTSRDVCYLSASLIGRLGQALSD